MRSPSLSVNQMKVKFLEALSGPGARAMDIPEVKVGKEEICLDTSGERI